MDEKILRFRVGIFVVIAGCILGILIFLNSEGWTKQYIVYIKTDMAPGVKVGTPIRKFGILIGRVDEVEVIKGERAVTLTLRINDDQDIFQNQFASIGSESILGDAGIEILPLPANEPLGELVTAGTTLNNVTTKRDPFTMMADIEPKINRTLEVMQDAGVSVDEASTKIASLSTTIQEIFKDDEGQLKGLLSEFRETNNKAKAAFDNFDLMFEHMIEIVGDPELKSQLKTALGDVLPIINSIRETVDKTSLAVDKFGTIPDGVNASFADIKELTSTLKEQAPEVIEHVNSSLENADELFKQAKQFTAMLNELDLENGTVGKLLGDTEIHDQILESARNVAAVTAKLEPLMRDLRNFADQLARNPGSIVKGALRREGDANYKGTAGGNGGIFK